MSQPISPCNTSSDIPAAPDMAEDGSVSRTIGAFAVQCCICFKWRLLPSQQKYEEISESTLEEPFVCRRASEWRGHVSCDDAGDIVQDGTRPWPLDKPVARPPPGWQRLIRIREHIGTRFADIYYVAPTGERLRCMNNVEKYLQEHRVMSGVNKSLFSFHVPKLLNEGYVRKRAACEANHDHIGSGEHVQVNLDHTASGEPIQVNPDHTGSDEPIQVIPNYIGNGKPVQGMQDVQAIPLSWAPVQEQTFHLDLLNHSSDDQQPSARKKHKHETEKV